MPVSAFAETRDALRKLALNYLNDGMDVVEVDFQPFKKR
jgi:hypothetical protein